MAKKSNTYSQVRATEALEELGQRGTTAAELVYDLLRIFAGYGDGQVRRTKEGPGNLAKDGVTVVVKNLVAYRPAERGSAGTGPLYDTVDAMRGDARIARHSPRLYIASDGTDLVAYDPKENDYYENSVALLWKDFEFFTPLAGIEKIQFATEAEADVKSAELMAKLFDDIRRYNDIRDPQTVHALNVFMSRLLFCFFAEDTGLFPQENLFTNTLRTHTKDDGSDVAEFIDRAFLAMSTSDPEVLGTLPQLYEVFPYVNGGLFKERYPIPVLSRRARTLIINCGDYNWRDITPDIFGSMIQAVVTPEQRAGMGMHYTSVTNIRKVICPLFLDSLEEEYAAACAEARAKMEAGANSSRATQRLRALLDRLAAMRFFDPACGSGNFLIVSYKLLRDLEIRIWQAMRDICKVASLPVPAISLTQFYGIELDEYACDTATLSLWLAEHQMNVKFHDAFGVQPDTLPLKPSGHIVNGNACRLDWDTVCPHTPTDEVYIMGNPPYLGSSLQSEEQKEDMMIAVGKLCKGYKKLDYIATWFIKAAYFCKDSKSSFAFVTTNSITQGEQVPILWPVIFNSGLEISFAYNSFKWSNNAKYNAGVTVAIIGMKSAPTSHLLFYHDRVISPKHINAYLMAFEDIDITPKTKSISGLQAMIFGSKSSDGGFLILSKEEKNMLTSSYPEASKFIKRYVGSDDSINGFERFCIWVEDEQYAEANMITPLNERFMGVTNMRLASSKKQTKEMAAFPYKFTEIRYEDTPCLVIPRVSSERRQYIPFSFFERGTVVDGSSQVIYNATPLTFAVINSKMHNLWVRAVGGRLKTDIRYSATLCYNTFPFPRLTAEQKAELEDLAQEVLNMREENCHLTLGEMYNPESMPADLREAHRRLDLAVERIYRPEPFTSDEERLEHLFRLYAKMTKH